MPDYQERYQMLFRVTERAIQILIDAQRTCDRYISSFGELRVSQLLCGLGGKK